jgi:hypothetical protein
LQCESSDNNAPSRFSCVQICLSVMNLHVAQ